MDPQKLVLLAQIALKEFIMLFSKRYAKIKEKSFDLFFLRLRSDIFPQTSTPDPWPQVQRFPDFLNRHIQWTLLLNWMLKISEVLDFSFEKNEPPAVKMHKILKPKPQAS